MTAAPPLGKRFREQVAALVGSAEAVSGNVSAWAQRERERAQNAFDEQAARIDERFRREDQSARSHLAGEAEAALAALENAALRIKGSLGSTSGDISYDPPTTPPDQAVIGAVSGSPVVVPLIGHRGLLLRGDADACESFAETIFTRVVASVPLTSLRLSVFDPSMRGLLGGFARLREHSSSSAFPRPFVDSEAFRSRLDDITGDVSETAGVLRGMGRSNITEAWTSRSPAPMLDVVVVDDRPGTLDDRAWTALTRVVENGAPNGVLAIVIQSGSSSGTELVGPLTRITFTDHTSAQLQIGADALSFEALASTTPTVRQVVVDGSIRAAASQTGPVIGPEKLRYEGPEASSASGMDIVIGERPDGRDLRLVFSSGGSNPLPNALVGGATGQGKSNLLLAIIYAIAEKYSPEDVEMLLLDFKEGLEFQRFAGTDGADFLPHASVIGLESDRAFGLSVLRYLEEERQRRGQVFKDPAVKVNDYDAYRAAGHSMPRLMLFIDEFQVLFEAEDEIADQAARLLETFVRRGRAAGFHLILSTQTLSGLRSLGTRTDAIFSQVKTRVSLWTNESESQTILSTGNKAAARLRFPGEVVVNTRAGEDEDSNIIGRTTFAESTATTQLQREIWSRHPHQNAPRLFNGNADAPFPDASALPASTHALRRVALGTEVDVRGTTVTHDFGRDPHRSLAIVGTDQHVRRQIERSVVHGAIGDDQYEHIIVIGDDELRAWTSAHAGSGIVTVDHEDAAEWLLNAGDMLRAERTLVVVSDLQLIDGLGVGSPVDPDDPFSAHVSAGTVLAGLVTDNGVRSDVVVSARMFQNLDTTFSYARDGGSGFAAYALADVPLGELRQIMGHLAEAPSGSPRFLYARAGSGAAAQLAVPFHVADERMLA